MQTVSKVYRAQVYQLLSEKQNSHYALLPAAFNPLPPSADRGVCEKQLCNQSSQCKNMEIFSFTKSSYYIYVL